MFNQKSQTLLENPISSLVQLDWGWRSLPGLGEDVKAEGGGGGDLGEEAGEAGVESSICSGDPGRMGPRDPTSATKQGSFLLLLLRPLAGQPQSHTPREQQPLPSNSCILHSDRDTTINHFLENQLPWELPFSLLGAPSNEGGFLGSNVSTSCCRFIPMGSRTQRRGC